MALIVPAARPNHVATRNRRNTHRPPARGRVKADRRKVSPKPKNRIEKAIAAALIDAGLSFSYEPHLFKTARSGKRRGAIRPDFYLSDLNVYLEVTQGDDYKQSFLGKKIADAQRENHVRVLLIGPTEFDKLRRGRIDITSLIESLMQPIEEDKSQIAA